MSQTVPPQLPRPLCAAEPKTSGVCAFGDRFQSAENNSLPEPISEQLPELITIGELAKQLRIGKTQTYALLNSGRLPVRGIRIGQRWRFSRAEVQEFCSGQLADQHDGDAGD